MFSVYRHFIIQNDNFKVVSDSLWFSVWIQGMRGRHWGQVHTKELSCASPDVMCYIYVYIKILFVTYFSPFLKRMKTLQNITATLNGDCFYSLCCQFIVLSFAHHNKYMRKWIFFHSFPSFFFLCPLSTPFMHSRLVSDSLWTLGCLCFWYSRCLGHHSRFMKCLLLWDGQIVKRKHLLWFTLEIPVCDWLAVSFQICG